MKTFFKSLSLMTIAACAGLSLASCTADKDLYNQDVVEENTKSTYEENFIKKFGSKINIADQDWDLADTYTSHLTPMRASRTTRATFTPAVSESEGYYELMPETRQWLDVNLKEKTDNRSQASSFVLSMPSNSFTIVPIYIGEALYKWKLELVIVDDETGLEMAPIKIWEKGENVQISEDGENWKTLGTGRYETTINSPYVRAKQYTVDSIPAGNDMKVLLKITTDKGVEYTSLDEGMVMLQNCPTPTNLPKMDDGTERKIMIVGCEDQYDKDSDWDMNDVVFMVYGNPELPGEKRVEEYYQRAYKRYLMEDLGATDDFDFNDIVVDAFAERKITKTYVGDNLISTVVGEWENEFANLKHLGGILPYSVKIGDTVLPWTEAALDVDKDEYSAIEGWNPRENNIELTVEGRGKNDEVFTRKIKFPKKGEIPMIIAVRPSQEWMAERQIIPSDWFTEE